MAQNCAHAPTLEAVAASVARLRRRLDECAAAEAQVAGGAATFTLDGRHRTPSDFLYACEAGYLTGAVAEELRVLEALTLTAEAVADETQQVAA